MARCTAQNWKFQLPWVLLGLRSAPRADGTPSAAEKTYGESLVVLGELVTEDRHNPSLQRLHDVVGRFAPCKRPYTDRSTTFTLPGLPSTTHIFVRDDAVCPPLTRPYRGPFRVLERNSKAFLLALPGRNDWVSIDWLKPALLEEDTDVTAAHPLPQPGPRKQRHPSRYADCSDASHKPEVNIRINLLVPAGNRFKNQKLICKESVASGTQMRWKQVRDQLEPHDIFKLSSNPR
ncbi:uncharacterized protein [Macrobrachium rosenbergii]|uniref:uncharacterized protein n=1 Tax=Macrobrachium rosenbergii TaxID=79674 RepID=UPI0034D658CB